MGPVPRARSLRWALTKMRAMEAWQRSAIIEDHVSRRLSTLQKRLPARPQTLWIESTNHCNLDCRMCDRKGLSRPIRHMEWSLFEKIADEAVKMRVPRIKLNRFGEALLHPDIYRMVTHLKRLRIPWVFFVSNGTLLEQAARESLIDSGLDLLAVSIDGFKAETYERLRRGARLEQVRRNVEEFVRLRNKRGRRRPLVQVNAILMEENSAEMPDLIRYWERRADFVNILCFAPLGEYRMQAVPGPVAAAELSACHHVTGSLLVFANGDVAVCCADYNGTLIIGNAGRESLGDLWRGVGYERIRFLQRSGKFDELPFCRQCFNAQSSKLAALFRQNHEVYRAASKGACR